MRVAIMDHKLTTLVPAIASLSEEDVQKLFIEVFQFLAIHACMITKMEELLADTFEDSRTISESLKPPRRSCKLSTLPSTSTHIEARYSSNEDGSCSEGFEKTDKDADYVLESETEASKEECREPIAPVAKLVSIMLSWPFIVVLSLHFLSSTSPCIELYFAQYYAKYHITIRNRTLLCTISHYFAQYYSQQDITFHITRHSRPLLCAI